MTLIRFNPHNGEIILKAEIMSTETKVTSFQSPQWGNSSKVNKLPKRESTVDGFSPRNGEIILK